MNCDFIILLRCPLTKSALVSVDKSELDRINERIRQGTLLFASAVPIEEPVEAAVKTEDGQIAYRCIGGIPMMFPDRAIFLDQSSISL